MEQMKSCRKYATCSLFCCVGEHLEHEFDDETRAVRELVPRERRWCWSGRWGWSKAAVSVAVGASLGVSFAGAAAVVGVGVGVGSLAVLLLLA